MGVTPPAMVVATTVFSDVVVLELLDVVVVGKTFMYRTETGLELALWELLPSCP